jgi:transmembrane sensor
MKKTDALQRYIENQAMEWLVKLNNPNLADAEIQQFNQWLVESPMHQAAYIRAEQIWAASEKLVSTKPMKSKFVSWQYALASFFIVLCVFFYQYSINPTADYEFYTGIGEQKTFDLADGSTVTLNNQSRLIFSINKNSRKVQLVAGEVLFHVTTDAKRPFDIETHDGMIRVVGTTFSVNRYSKSTLVTVVEGRVALGQKPLAADSFVASQVLIQSQQQTLSAAIKGYGPKQVDVKSELSWREKRLVVRDEALGDVVSYLEKSFPVKFNISSKELSERRITAVLDLSNLDQVLLVLQTSLSIKIERDSEIIRLSEK